MASLDTSFILGLIIVVVVGFFAYQWVSKRAGAPRPSTLAPVASPTATAVAALASSEPSGAIPGQTAQETGAKERLQQRVPANQQQPIPTSSFPGAGSAQFESTLRHPEQLFHQPSGMAANPHIQQTSDVPSGRASQFTQPSPPGQQGYSPEMTQTGGGMLLAQNNGLLMGNSVMAFDSVSMDPMGSGLTAF
jgi:hypothetical protein